MSTAPLHVKLNALERREIIELLVARHSVHLEPGERFEVDGHVSHGEAWLKMTLSDPEETDVLDLEARIDLVSNEIQDPNSGKYTLIDFLDEAFIQFFEEDRWMRSELQWKSYDYQGNELQFRSERRNKKLDDMADHLLNSN